MSKPDFGIKKVIIPADALPPLAIVGNDLFYIVRYRAISEDKTRTSAWSPLYDLQARTVSSIIANDPAVNFVVYPNSDKTILSMVWNTPPSLKTSGYDIYIDWQDNQGASLSSGYVGSVLNTTNNSFAVPVYSGAKKAMVQIQVTTFPKITNTSATVVKTSTAVTI